VQCILRAGAATATYLQNSIHSLLVITAVLSDVEVNVHSGRKDLGKEIPNIRQTLP
jgi:hypothetical protein